MGTAKSRFLRLMAVACCLPVIVGMPGCATSKSARYFQLDLKLAIDKQTYDIAYNWHCNEVMDGPNFGPGGILKARWVWSPYTYMVLKKLENGSALLFNPPQYCGDEVAGATKEVLLVDSLENPEVMEIFTQRRSKGARRDVVITSANVRQLVEPRVDYSSSAEEKKGKDLLESRSRGYQSISASVFPESIWKSDENLVKLFSRAQGILLAPIAQNEREQHNFFSINRMLLAPDFDWDAYTVPLFKVGGEWKFTERSTAASAFQYVAPDSTTTDKTRSYDIGRPPLAFVSYRGTLVEVQNSRQVFDAEKRLLIQFVNEYRPYPWIGQQK
jgi:hypothetical protein